MNTLFNIPTEYPDYNECKMSPGSDPVINGKNPTHFNDDKELAKDFLITTHRLKHVITIEDCRMYHIPLWLWRMSTPWEAMCTIPLGTPFSLIRAVYSSVAIPMYCSTNRVLACVYYSAELISQSLVWSQLHPDLIDTQAIQESLLSIPLSQDTGTRTLQVQAKKLLRPECADDFAGALSALCNDKNVLHYNAVKALEGIPAAQKSITETLASLYA